MNDLIRRSPFAIALVTGALLAAGCSDNSDSVDRAELEKAEEEAEEEAQDELQKELDDLQAQLDDQATTGGGTTGGGTTGGGTTGGSTAPAGLTFCADAVPSETGLTGRVAVNANTSCPFAFNVIGSANLVGIGNPMEVNSPTTGRSYMMSCQGTWGGDFECTGGNNARVVYVP